ncbi:methylmalonyl-CoA mutase subunit beta [Taklimakanibacter lacteus]|uniref:methylmalonyl-CoA mutase subunit beta n=1 Tax=Taklimakanibacter lacteus TaxID=2268456 RepID=UPI0013C4E52E
MSDTLPIASEFPAAGESDWRRRVEAVLKGADFEKRLTSKTADGIAIGPLYGTGKSTEARRREQTPWTVMQRVDHPDAGKANKQALEDLNHGATGLNIIFGEASSAHGFGLAAPDRKSFGRLLADIRVDAIALRVSAGRDGASAALALAEWIATQPIDPERLTLSFGLDPIGIGVPMDLRQTVDLLREQHFTGPFAEASGIVWHDAGASEVQELALTLATGVAYLRRLDKLPGEILKRAVGLALAADQDMFATLAKFRALRLLWSRVLAASGLEADALQIHGETSWRMMTAQDPHTNILRSTAAVFGASLGGADLITVLPFSLAQGLPDEFARRIARNTQTILQEESQLWRVSDPASGSGYIEHLTRSFCEAAWSLFQDIEKRGGILAAIESGHVATLIAEKRQQRLFRIQGMTETIIGVTRYRSLLGMPAAIEDVAPGRPVNGHRLAELFEAEGGAQ